MNHKTNPCPICGSRKPKTINPASTKQRVKAAQSLACHLIVKFQVANSKSLIFILGYGNESSNQEAIAHWIMDRISHIAQWPLSSDGVNDLIDTLERDLGSILTDLQYGSHYVQ